MEIPSSSGVKIVTRKCMFEQMQLQNLPSIDEKLEFLENHLLLSCGDTVERKKSLKHKFSYIKHEFKQRWLKAHKVEEVFMKNNQKWLEGTFEIPVHSLNQPGRPSKSFSDSSERSKRRKTEEIRSNVDDEMIIHAAQVILQTKGKRNASKVLKDIRNSPTKASKYRKAYSKTNETIAPLTPFQALKVFVEADLTRRQYEIIRASNPKHYPCYDLLLKAKQECYPPKTALRVTATCAEINLQCLMDHTIQRLSIYLEEVLSTLNEIERKSLTIIYKWGCDGSQQARYKQKFSEDAESDASIFLSSFVPLQIICGKENNKVLWQNPTPSSPRFCRPIRFRYVKETTDVTKEEISYVQNEIKNLTPTKVNIDGKEFAYNHILKMTMIDGKVCNAVTNTTSTSRCYICGATSKDFNNLSKKNEISPDALEFGISVLHAKIRIFESILHLAYKLPVKKYGKKRTEEEKALEQERKKEIQERFRLETGLLVDMPKANFGNTNDGNTSRRFFENTELAADITGINHELIHKFKILLEAISSGHKINTTKFEEYAFNTAQMYVELYGWHPMTPTMHKLLLHGATIIDNALLPIGQLSEEAAEARNKHFRSYRQNFSRKFSREECNRDIYQRLLLTSDPLVSSERSLKKTSHNIFSSEVIELLEPAEPHRQSSIEHEEVEIETSFNKTI